MVIVAMALVAQPALAAKQPDNPLPGSRIEREYTSAINKLERYLSISETGNIVLNAPKGVVKSINSEVHQSLLAGLEQTNSMIDSGYMVANPDFTLTVTEKYLEDCNQYLEPGQQLIAEGNAVYLVEGVQTLSYSGVTKVVWHWWGFHLYLDNALCIRICAGLYFGSAIALIIPDPVVSKVVCIALAGMASTIMATNVYGRGVIIRFHYMPPPLPPVVPTGIWSQ